MENILPFILETLSTKPQSEETEKNLIKELRLKYKQNRLKTTNLRKDFDNAILVGEDLGIFRIVDENVKIPFSLKNKTNQAEMSDAGGPSQSSSLKNLSEDNNPEMADKTRGSGQKRRASRSRSRSRKRKSRSRSRSRSRRRR